MFDSQTLTNFGLFGLAFLGFTLLFIFVAASAARQQRKEAESKAGGNNHADEDFDQALDEFDPDHHGHVHSHSCKYDQDEQRRTAALPRPLIPVDNLPAPNPRVQAALDKVSLADMQTMLSHLTGAQSYVIAGETKTMVTRNSHTAESGIALAAEYMVASYQTAGITAELWPYTVRGTKYNNVRFIIPGKKNPNKVLVLGAHLDSTAGRPWNKEGKAPGAEDDGSGTVALYNAACAIHALGGLDCTVHIVHFTGEEQGLWGSYAYSDWLSREVKAKGQTVIGMIEMDMVGYCPNPRHRLDVHDEVNRNGSHAITVAFFQQIARYKLNLAPFDTHNLSVKDRSDHAGFLDKGWPAVLLSEEFTDEAFYPHYHTTRDTIDKINFPYLREVTRAVIAVSCEMGGLS